MRQLAIISSKSLTDAQRRFLKLSSLVRAPVFVAMVKLMPQSARRYWLYFRKLMHFDKLNEIFHYCRDVIYRNHRKIILKL